MLQLLLSAALALSNDPSILLRDDDVVRELAQMVVLAAGMRACEGEHAAFVVRRADGKLAVVRWSTDCAALGKTYRGFVPPNTVAIVHTHPEGRSQPSMQDVAEAKRIKRPICVLTRKGIWVADPAREGQPYALIENPRWTSVSSAAP